MNLGQSRRAALIFDGVVQQGRDRLVLVAAVFQDDGRDGEQVRDIRHVGPFARCSACSRAA